MRKPWFHIATLMSWLEILVYSGINSIIFEIRFPPTFPLAPPFFRIIKPRLLPFIQVSVETTEHLDRADIRSREAAVMSQEVCWLYERRARLWH